MGLIFYDERHFFYEVQSPILRAYNRFMWLRRFSDLPKKWSPRNKLVSFYLKQIPPIERRYILNIIHQIEQQGQEHVLKRVLLEARKESNQYVH